METVTRIQAPERILDEPKEVRVQDYRKLSVWAKSHRLVLMIYEITGSVSEKRYPGLTSQIRRAAASIPANIAEGCGHRGRREFSRFLGIALASSFELSYHLQLAADLGMIAKSEYARVDARTDQVRRMLSSLISKVKQAADAPRAVGEQTRANDHAPTTRS
jgi:four helix bundle protein